MGKSLVCCFLTHGVEQYSSSTAGPRIWNGLPGDVTSATSLLTFRRKLKAHLFLVSTILSGHYFVTVSVIRHGELAFFYLGHYV